MCAVEQQLGEFQNMKQTIVDLEMNYNNIKSQYVHYWPLSFFRWQHFIAFPLTQNMQMVPVTTNHHIHHTLSIDTLQPKQQQQQQQQSISLDMRNV